jgi:hypothetical protein
MSRWQLGWQLSAKINDLAATRLCRSNYEPPIGIEPMTYSLRVNRSAD